MRADEPGEPGDADEALMLRYRAGDAAAFDRIYARHRGGLYRYLLRQCGQRGIAEELFQDVWMNLIRARESYVVQARFSTWLYRIAHNRVIDHYRASPRGLPASFDDDAGPDLDDVDAGRTADPAVRVESRQQARLLLTWLEALPAAQREAFLMHQEAGMAVEEIAAATGVNRETAKSRLRYAMARLRAASRADGLTPPARSPDPVPPGAGGQIATAGLAGVVTSAIAQTGADD